MIDVMITADQSKALEDLHYRWSGDQIQRGVDGPTPPDHPDDSDYNQHYQILEASGADQDAYFDEANRIMGLPPAR